MNAARVVCDVVITSAKGYFKTPTFMILLDFCAFIVAMAIWAGVLDARNHASYHERAEFFQARQLPPLKPRSEHIWFVFVVLCEALVLPTAEFLAWYTIRSLVLKMHHRCCGPRLPPGTFDLDAGVYVVPDPASAEEESAKLV